MRISLFAYSRRGMETAVKFLYLASQNDAEIICFAPERLAETPFEPIPMPSVDFYGEQFERSDALIFVGAAGIAVRAIAPHVRSKLTDPAVLCIDEQGKYVIPLLSGHIGGANQLAKEIADTLSAKAVITTATDINGRFSVDSWAVRNGFIINNMTLAKEISAAILERDIPLSSSLPISTDLPAGLICGESGALGIFIGWEKRAPFTSTLRLIPPILHLGLGCRRGTSAQTIREAVDRTLEQYNIDPKAVRSAASIDLKADEPGLQEYLQSRGLSAEFYSAEKLLEVPGEFSHSDFVQHITGVDNVCERAAMIGAKQLIVPKTVFSGVTIALAAEEKEVRF